MSILMTPRTACVLVLFAVDLVPALRRKSTKMRKDDLELRPAGNETTSEGCFCADAPCGASFAQHHRCDWCETPRGCGQYLLTRGWYDFCDFKPMDQFRGSSHQEQLQTLWENVIADNTSGPTLSTAETLIKILTLSMITVFDNARDVNPETRVKVIHGQGAVLQFDLRVQNDSPYTGILMPGTRKGLMRMGSANPASTDGIFPGVAVKFLRSGTHSGNSNMLRATGASDGAKQFFEVGVSNHVPPPQALALLQKFNQASGCQSMTGLSDMCSYEQDGTFVRAPKFPYEWRLDAVDPMQFSFDYSARDLDAEMLRALTSIPKGTHLYNVVAKESPTAQWKTLGQVVTRSVSVTSQFGDTQMSFRHQRMEEDFSWHPEWVPLADQPLCTESVDRNGNLRPVTDWQCPNAIGVGLHPFLPDA